jgi:catalase
VRRKTSQKKKLTTNAGTPVVDNQNTMTAGPCGPDYSLFDESHNERSKYHE